MTQRPRIPGRVARRIDRMARAAHRFHRFAHHPLCSDYAGEVVHLGRRTRVCRGCAFVLVGVAVGGVLALGVRSSTAWHVAAVVTATLLLASSLARFPEASRRSKLATRLVPTAALTYATVGVVSSRTLASMAVTLLAITAFAMAAALYRRRKPDRGPCKTCPERLQVTPCRGYVDIVRRERAFHRRAAQLVQIAIGERASSP